MSRGDEAFLPPGGSTADQRHDVVVVVVVVVVAVVAVLSHGKEASRKDLIVLIEASE